MSNSEQVLLDIKNGWGLTTTRLVLNEFPELKEIYLTIAKVEFPEEYLTFHMGYGELLLLQAAISKAIDNANRKNPPPEF